MDIDTPDESLNRECAGKKELDRPRPVSRWEREFMGDGNICYYSHRTLSASTNRLHPSVLSYVHSPFPSLLSPSAKHSGKEW